MNLTLSIPAVIRQALAQSGLHATLSRVEVPVLGPGRQDALRALIPAIAGDMAVRLGPCVSRVAITDDAVELNLICEPPAALPLVLALERYMCSRLTAQIWASADPLIAAASEREAESTVASLSAWLEGVQSAPSTVMPSRY